MKAKISMVSTAPTYTYRHWYLPSAHENEDAGEYVGRVARYLRECLGMTQKQIADFSRKHTEFYGRPFTQAYISRLESGKWQSIKRAHRYISGFGLDMRIDMGDRSPAANPENTTSI